MGEGTSELSVPEAAEVLQVRPATVLNMIEDGRLTVTRTALHGTARRRYVSRESVEREKARREGRVTQTVE